ncbi:uncharacterized protein LOC113209828 [Frankliniella occidentalis]|uniref:Uncharacterized protein LOC113209828 n=1 Tax=Frankliniella occidentalis TaxID=133901 RepID=A0A6J1SR77_FRAOC|nr:uncharacterized protein LOC113209828 [Frankliniella occidentalis]
MLRCLMLAASVVVVLLLPATMAEGESALSGDQIGRQRYGSLWDTASLCDRWVTYQECVSNRQCSGAARGCDEGDWRCERMYRANCECSCNDLPVAGLDHYDRWAECYRREECENKKEAHLRGCTHFDCRCSRAFLLEKCRCGCHQPGNVTSDQKGSTAPPTSNPAEPVTRSPPEPVTSSPAEPATSRTVNLVTSRSHMPVTSSTVNPVTSRSPMPVTSSTVAPVTTSPARPVTSSTAAAPVTDRPCCPSGCSMWDYGFVLLCACACVVCLCACVFARCTEGRDSKVRRGEPPPSYHRSHRREPSSVSYLPEPGVSLSSWADGTVRSEEADLVSYIEQATAEVRDAIIVSNTAWDPRSYSAQKWLPVQE